SWERLLWNEMTLWLAPFLIVSAFGQTSDVPYAPDSDGPGPTFTIRQLRNCYPGSFSSIQTINFGTFKFLNFGNDGKPSGGYALKNGHFQRDTKFDHYSTNLESVHSLPKWGPPAGESVLVILSWFAAAG